jgi:hypothetical protein
VLPSFSDYRAAFDELHAAFPSVRLFTAWNEPNHAREPTAYDPAAAAHYADIVAEECPDCSVIAGDVLDAPGMLSYLNFYKAALTTTPAAWGLHNYYDTTYFQSSGTDAFLHAVDGPVWLSESGGIVTWRRPDGSVQLSYDEQRAAAALSYGLTLAADRADRIERMYVYQWRAAPWDDFDAGLVRPDGSERPALAVLRSALGLAPTTTSAPGVAGDGAGSLVAPPPAARARIVLGAIRLDRRRQLRVTLRCASGACHGGLTVEGSGRVAERLVNGRTTAGTLEPRKRGFMLANGARTTIRFHVPRAVIRRGGRRGLTIKVTVVPVDTGGFIPVRRGIRFPRSLQLSG